MKEAIIKYNEEPSGALLAIEWHELVRCKDCKWYEPTPDKDEPDRGWCSGICNSLCAVHDDWFCADGERRIDNG